MVPSEPAVGIVVPTLNAAVTLRATLLSLRAAVTEGAEILLVDGGSTDDTVAIAESEGVAVVSTAGNMYAAVNAGFRRVRGEWLTWINADDLLYADRLGPRVRSAAGADVLYGPVDFIDPAGRFVHAWTSAAATDLLPLYRAGYSPLLQQGTLFRRSVFERMHGFDESYRFVADADFWWRALEAGVVFRRATHPPVGAFRLHAGQLSQRFAREMRAEHDRMVAGHGGRRRTLRSWLGLLRLRGVNLSSYAIRFLRRGVLEGWPRMPGSYDVVRQPR